MSEKRGAGRPPGAKYPVKKLIRMSEATAAALERQAQLERTTEAEAVRVAIEERLRRIDAAALREENGQLRARVSRLEAEVRRLRGEE